MNESQRKIQAGKHFIPPLVLLVVTAIFFREALFEEKILSYRDLFFFHYPLRYYWMSQYLNGFLPYINAAMNGGQPLLANPNYAVFYPGNVFFLVASFHSAWNWSLVFHVYWAALGTYYFTRRLGCSQAASLVAAIAFAFSGPVLSAMNYYNLLIAASWIPWILLSTSKGIERGGRWIAIAALALSAQLLAGEPTVQMITYAFLVAAGMAYALHPSSIAPAKRADVFYRLLSIALLAIGLSAVQIIPTLLWLPHSGRSETLDFRLSAAYWSLPPARLIELLAPHFFGNPMSSLSKDFWGSRISDSGYPYIFKIYCGWLPLLLALFGARARMGRFALAVTVCALGLSLGRHLPGYQTLFDVLPPLRLLRYPEKFLLPVSFSLAAAAAFGLDSILMTEKRRSLGLLFLSAAPFLALLLIVRIGYWPHWMTEPQRELQLRAIWNAALWLSVASLVIILAAGRPSPAVGFLFVVVLACDLFIINADILKTRTVSEVEKPPVFLYWFPQIKDVPLLHQGEDQMDLYFASDILPENLLKEALHPLLGLQWGIQYGATDDIDRLSWKMSSARQKWIHRHFPEPEALEEMRQSGIGRVLSLSGLNNPHLPIDYFVQFKSNKFIWLYRLKPPALAPIRWLTSGESVDSRSPAPYHLQIKAETRKPATLLILRNAIPGWSCQIDQRKALVKSTEQGWIVIDVPAGKHQVELNFMPPGLIAGMCLSGMTLLIALRLLLLV